MLPKPEQACFIIADISGYTKFLAATEIEHAQDIVADLMDTVVKGLRPPFRLAKFEGDAAFLYAVSTKLDGSQLQDAIEQAYFKFRRRLRDVKQASACECNACKSMGELDFKFVVHHGAMVRQRMGGREELAGRDVILVHRLLKNSAGEKLGGTRAYVLYSDACAEAMGMDAAAQGLTEHKESIDIIGDVKVWLRDLDAAWRAENELNQVEITRDEAHSIWEFAVAAPRQMVWEHFTVPGQWQTWWPADAIIEHSAKGRRGVGTKNHCMHGKDAIIEEVLDWRPTDYFTVSIQLPVLGAPRIVMTRAFFDRPDGTTFLEMRIGRPKPEHKEFVDQVAAKRKVVISAAIDELGMRLAALASSIRATEEPRLPETKGRFLTQPGAPKPGG